MTSLAIENTGQNSNTLLDFSKLLSNIFSIFSVDKMIERVGKKQITKLNKAMENLDSEVPCMSVEEAKTFLSFLEPTIEMIGNMIDELEESRKGYESDMPDYINDGIDTIYRLHDKLIDWSEAATIYSNENAMSALNDLRNGNFDNFIDG